MDYKDIVVFLDASPDTEARLDLAVSLAQANGARLLGVDVSPPSAFEGRWREQATMLQDTFEGRLGQSGLDGEYRIADRATASWKDFYAHYADLVIATQRDEESLELVSPEVPEEVLLAAGVPMLVLTHGWRPAPIGASVVLAWNSSREATRAAHDALPILARARKVTLFAYAPHADMRDNEAELMAGHLRRHAVPVEIHTWPAAGSMTPIEALFACLDTQEADLVVAGCYGHSRWMERLFGSASQDLLGQRVMPTLLSH